MIERFPHLCAALVACFLLSAGLLGGVAYADSLETEYIHALAAMNLQQKRQGLVLQRLAMRQDDLLPVYGSSELDIRNPYRAAKIFLSYPTGFNVFTVGGNNDGPILQLQIMAGMGDELRGKRIVISLSPQFFLQSALEALSYRGNYSRLHAYAFALSDLPMSIKQAAAQRMLEYPQTVQRDALLWMVMKQVAEGEPQSQVMYALLYPLAKLHELTLELQDHWEVVNLIWEHPEIKPEIERRPQPRLNWNMLESHATRYAESLVTNNPFGIPDADWKKYWRKMAQADRNSMSDARFVHMLKVSRTWSDLKLFLEVLKFKGAQPLIITLPWHGVYWDMRGVSATARQVYYQKLTEFGQREGVPVVTFEQFDGDKYFLVDPNAHLSARGWVFYSQVLDAFYHGELKGVEP